MKESLLTEIFLHAGLFFALGSLIIPVLRYFKIPTALGYLLAGIAVGPYGLGALVATFPFLDAISLEDAEHVKILAELSIILLLFVIGLELTPLRLWQMRNLVFGLGQRAGHRQCHYYRHNRLFMGKQHTNLYSSGAQPRLIFNRHHHPMAAREKIICLPRRQNKF